MFPLLCSGREQILLASFSYSIYFITVYFFVPAFLCIVSSLCFTYMLAIQTQPQLKTAIMVPYFVLRNVLVFSQWIQGWFVWISLISHSYLNYWCTRVRSAFPVTDGLRSSVIFPLCYSSFSSSFFFRPFPTRFKLIFWVAKGFPSPTRHPLIHPFPLPCHVPFIFFINHPSLCTPWHFDNNVLSWSDFFLFFLPIP